MNKEIKRYPVIKDDPLQAWDSADELILQELSKQETGKRILIINDSFGALSTSYQGVDVTSYTDSYVSSKAINFNSGGSIECFNDLNTLTGIYDVVLMRIPKNMSFFEDIICHLTQHMDIGTRIICGVMVKHLAKTSFELLEKYIGPVSTSLAQKKARLIFAIFQKEKVQSPYPMQLKLEGFEKEFIHHSNLFSREKLDIGTRFLLEYIPKGPYKCILDLGCGNGIIGIAAKKMNPEARIIFSDESNMAIQSARANYENYFSDAASFYWTNCFEGEREDVLDLVICNPPFHQNHTVGDFIAWQMFTDSYLALQNGGKIRVIGNSHLGYQHKLKKIFGNSRIIASNQKFMIIDATR